MKGFFSVSLCAISMLMVWSNQAEAQQVLPGTHERGSWYIGFGLGSGNGSFKLKGVDESIKLSDIGGDVTDPLVLGINFKVGATISDQLLIGADISAIRSQADTEVTVLGSTTKVSQAVQLNSYNAVVTWFPLREGVFVRGGLGLAIIGSELAIGNEVATADVTGFGAQVGAGFALWLLTSYNMSLNIDYHLHTYNGEDGEPESGDFWNAYLGFEWF